MQISRKTVYAVKALAYVAGAKGKRSCTISEIAESGDIPREYLAKILNELSQKGFLKSFKGIHGGYRLARPPAKISFLDILEAIQEMPGTKGSSRKSDSLYAGVTSSFWNDLHRLVRNRLSKMTLSKIH